MYRCLPALVCFVDVRAVVDDQAANGLLLSRERSRAEDAKARACARACRPQLNEK
jgi:hypothetical protein